MKELLQHLPRSGDLCGVQDEGFGPTLSSSDSSKGYSGRSPSESSEKTVCRHWIYMQRLVSYMFEVSPCEVLFKRYWAGLDRLLFLEMWGWVALVSNCIPLSFVFGLLSMYMYELTYSFLLACQFLVRARVFWFCYCGNLRDILLLLQSHWRERCSSYWMKFAPCRHSFIVNMCTLSRVRVSRRVLLIVIYFCHGFWSNCRRFAKEMTRGFPHSCLCWSRYWQMLSLLALALSSTAGPFI